MVSAPNHPKVVRDTLDSFRTWMTKDILVIVDGASWEEMSKQYFNAYLLEGLYHNYHRSPYRNVILGMWELSKKWPHADWYCYMEYDCLVASDGFVSELEEAESNGIWCLGSDPRQKQLNLPLLEKMLDSPITQASYVLGCCVFYNGEFIRQLHSFFEKFMNLTNGFTQGFFPGFNDYDLAEHLLPTLATHYGGKVGGLSQWNESLDKWTAGDYEKYPIRFRPDMRDDENFPKASIFHPIKNYDHSIREYNRKIRCKMNMETSKTT